MSHKYLNSLLSSLSTSKPHKHLASTLQLASILQQNTHGQKARFWNAIRKTITVAHTHNYFLP